MKIKQNIDNVKSFMEYMKDYKSIDAEEELRKILLQYQSNQIYKIINRKSKIKRIFKDDTQY
jgi:hypothetical protein